MTNTIIIMILIWGLFRGIFVDKKGTNKAINSERNKQEIFLSKWKPPMFFLNGINNKMNKKVRKDRWKKSDKGINRTRKIVNK